MKADRINELRISASSETFFTAFFNDSMTLESDKLYGGYYQSFVAKYDNSGNKLWAHDIGGVGFDCGRAMTTDASDNVYAGVVFNGVVDITRIIEPHQLTSLCENHAGIRNGNRPKMGQYC